MSAGVMVESKTQTELATHIQHLSDGMFRLTPISLSVGVLPRFRSASGDCRALSGNFIGENQKMARQVIQEFRGSLYLLKTWLESFGVRQLEGDECRAQGQFSTL